MEHMINYDFNLFQHIILPVLICLARVCDVSLGTIRIMYVAKGMKNLATVLGFFEVMIWLFALGQIMQNLTNWGNYMAYASGYAIGNFVGIVIEEKLSVGTLMLRIFSRRNAACMTQILRSAGYGATCLQGDGAHGPVDIVFTIIKRRDLAHIVRLIKENHPNAMYTVEDIKYVSSKPFPLLPEHRLGAIRSLKLSLSRLLQQRYGKSQRIPVKP